MRHAIGLALLVISGSLACCALGIRTSGIGQSAESSSQEPQPYLDRDAYDVYAAKLPEEWAWTEAHAKQIVIQQETTVFPEMRHGDACLPGGDSFPEDWKDALADYVKQNKTTRLLARGFVIDKPYSLIPRREFQDFFKSGVGKGWEGFYGRYPDSGGIIQLSAVGFNSDKNRALVYMGHSCGGLCGGGGYSFSEKKEGKWVRATVKGTSCAWAS
jgi:hypothetical protein